MTRAVALAAASLLLLAGWAALAATAAPEVPLPSAVRDLDGTVRDAYGLLAPPQPGAPQDLARAFLAAHADEFGIPDPDALRLDHVKRSLTSTHLRYAQLWEGAPVRGADVSVHVRHDGAVLAAHSRAVGMVLEGPAALSAAEATAVAQQVAEGTPVATERVVVAQGLVGVPAWEVRFQRALPLSAWLVHVDAATGDVLAARDTVRAAEAQGRVWINPIVASRDGDLRDNLAGVERDPLPVPLVAGGTDYGQWLTEVTLANLTEGPNGPVLDGPYATLRDGTASGADLRFPREDPRFEEVNAYYWIDWSQQRIQELGFDDVANYQLPIFVHDQPGIFNAFYRGDGQGQGEVHFGWHAFTGALIGGLPAPNGFADAAEDSEVVLHEYGHALLDNQVPNFGSSAEGGGIHEGFGDFWAGTQFSRLSGGYYDHCMGEWFTSYLYVTADGTPPCLRDMENFLTYDYDNPDGHLTGQLWSGALWNLRKGLGTEEGERLALEANFFLPVDGGFHEGAEALLMADVALHNGTHARAILQEFGSRNLTNLIVTPELLEQVRAADLALATQNQAPPRAVPGAEAALVLGLLGLLAVAARRRR